LTWKCLRSRAGGRKHFARCGFESEQTQERALLQAFPGSPPSFCPSQSNQEDRRPTISVPILSLLTFPKMEQPRPVLANASKQRTELQSWVVPWELHGCLFPKWYLPEPLLLI